MGIRLLHHVQLAMPKGGENAARRFYQGLLGLEEVRKPPILEARGGVWFETDQVRIHLGVEDDFRAAKKAHPAFEVDGLAELFAHLEAAGVAVTHDENLPEFVRGYVADPFGNRIELLEAKAEG